MNILVITQSYPDRKRSVFPFVKQLVNQFARMHHRCCVISPYSIVANKGFYPVVEIELVEGEGVVVLRPNHLTFSNLNILGFRPSLFFRKCALNKALKQLPFKPDIIYAHFWRSGREIYSYAKKHNIPLFVATGESVIPSEDISEKHKDFYNYVKGVICVSSKNKNESIDNGMTSEDKCIIVPNAINPEIFHVLDKEECRNRLGLPKGAFIVAFCGAFCNRKGVKKLSEALDSIDGNPVYSLFLGRPYGEEPSCKNILFQGAVKHEDLTSYLNAADIFVLPTLHEGCCNAIIEALACGLPVVSSDLPFNWDVLNENNSILVDPQNVSQIASAIKELRDNDKKRMKLSEGALEAAKELTIGVRAEKIINFIQIKLRN